MCFKCVFLSATEVTAYHNPSLGRLEKSAPPPCTGGDKWRLWEAAVNTDLEALLHVRRVRVQQDGVLVFGGSTGTEDPGIQEPNMEL